MKEFDKYDQLGAYHLDWFSTNKHGYRNHLNRILREFTGCKAKTILDIGCGEGLLAKLLLKKGVTQKVIGIDSNSTAIKLGKELYSNSCKTKKMELIEQSFSTMNKRRKFDYIVCSEVIEHADQPRAFIKKMCNMARKWTIITTPNANLINPGKYDKQLFTPCELEDMLINMGLKSEFLDIGETIVFKIIK